MNKTKKKIITAIVVILIIIALVIAFITVSTNMAKDAFAYSTVTAKNGDVCKYVSATGTSKAFNTDVVVAMKPGDVDKVSYSIGDTIKSNQTVITSDTSFYKSNIDGYVSSVAFKEGQRFNAGDVLFTVSDYSTLSVQVAVNESNYQLIKAEQTVEITFPAIPDKTYLGEVASITYDATSVNGVSLFFVDIKVSEENSNLNLIRNNMSAEVKIIANEANGVLTIPVLAISYDGDKPYVLVGTEGNYEKKYITIGITDGITCQVLDGIVEGEQLNYMDISSSRLEDMMNMMWG